MRIFLMAAVAACVAGAAWADTTAGDPNDDAVHSARIADEITRAVDEALRNALSDLESARLDRQTLVEVRAAMDAARGEVRTELAALDGKLAGLDEAEEAALEARLEAAMAGVETAMERASAALEAAAEAEAERAHGE